MRDTMGDCMCRAKPKKLIFANKYAFKNGIFWSRLTQKYNRSTYFPHGKKTTARGEKFLKRRVLSDSTF